MKTQLILAITLLTTLSSYGEVTTSGGPYDTVAPVLGDDPAMADRQAGQIYYKIGAGFKGVNANGNLETLSVSGTPVTSTASNDRIERVRFHGATDTTNCTSSPCSISRNSGGIASVTRSGAGQYMINFTAGVFSAPPVCVSTGTVVEIVAIPSSTDTATSVGINFYNTAGSTADGYANVICMGSK